MLKRFVGLSSLLLAACGDNVDSKLPARPDSGVFVLDASPDGQVPFVKPTPVKVPISAMGPDQIMSVAAGPSGTFYVAGYTAEQPTSAKMVFVAKLSATGALETNFGTGGIYTSALTLAGGADEIDVVVQATGKIVVAATIANDVNAMDRDIGLFRVDITGDLDSTFGTNGVARIDLSTAFDDAGTLRATDSQRGLAVGPGDKLFLHAVARDDAASGGTKDDSEFAVARLDANGALDTTYATSGVFLLDLQETNKIAVARSLHVLADGSVIAGGYARTADTIDAETNMATPQPVLYRLTPAGALDTSFAGDGVFHETVLTKQTEIYAFAIDGTNITTAGYGRDTGTANVFASMRFHSDTGARDATFGGALGGVVVVDPSGTLAGANCRNAIGLPGGRTALLGSTGGAGMRDAVVAILTEAGALDTSFDTGVQTFDLAAGEDQWWGGAVSGSALLVAGWRGFAADAQTVSTNDDSYVAVYKNL